MDSGWTKISHICSTRNLSTMRFVWLLINLLLSIVQRTQWFCNLKILNFTLHVNTDNWLYMLCIVYCKTTWKIPIMNHYCGCYVMSTMLVSCMMSAPHLLAISICKKKPWLILKTLKAIVSLQQLGIFYDGRFHNKNWYLYVRVWMQNSIFLVPVAWPVLTNFAAWHVYWFSAACFFVQYNTVAVTCAIRR